MRVKNEKRKGKRICEKEERGNWRGNSEIGAKVDKEHGL